MEPFSEVTLLFGDEARDGRESPIKVGLVELGGVDLVEVQARLELDQLVLVSNGEVNVRRVVIGRSAVLVGVFNRRVSSLDSLLREWEVAAGDGVEVVLLSDSRFHGILQWVDGTI